MDTLVSTVGFKNLAVKELIDQLNLGGITAVEFNLTPLFKYKSCAREAKWLFDVANINIEIADGGWCDFTGTNSEYRSSELRIDQQIQICEILNCKRLRLFVGNQNSDQDSETIDLIAKRFDALARNYPSFQFNFETHDERSCSHQFWESIFGKISVNNVGLVIDFANILVKSTYSYTDFVELSEKVTHLHIKGVSKNSQFSYAHESPYLTSDFIEFATQHFFNATFSVESEGALGNDIMKLRKSKDYVDFLLQEIRSK